MAIRVQCLNAACGVSFEVPDFYAGQKTRCVNCQAVINVPSSAPAAAAKRPSLRLGAWLVSAALAASALAGGSILALQLQQAKAEIARLDALAKAMAQRQSEYEQRAAAAATQALAERKRADEAEKRAAAQEAALHAERQTAEALRGQIDELQTVLAEARHCEERLRENLKTVAEEAKARDREWREALRQLQVAAVKRREEEPVPAQPAAAADLPPLFDNAQEALSSPAAPPLPAPDIVNRPFFEVGEFLARFEHKPETAEKEYRQRWVVLHGEAAQILETPGGRPYALLVPWDMVQGYRGALRCRCYAAVGREREWERLEAGSRVFIIGRVGGLFPPNIVYMLDCAIVANDAAASEIDRQAKEPRVEREE